MDDLLSGVHRVYRQAHDLYHWKAIEEDPLDQPEVIGYLDALGALKKRAFRVVPVGKDHLAEIISRKDWPGFRKKFPDAANEVWGYREDWANQLQALRKEVMVTFRDRFGTTPFSRESVDVLVDKGLKVGLLDSEKGPNLVVCRDDYEIYVNPRLDREKKRRFLARGLVELYYQLSDWELMIPEISRLHSQAGLLPTPLGKELQDLTEAALRQYPDLLDRWI
ncbi:MAG: hypothetical protein AABX70_08575 [Nanoarchaeota archaeon]